MLNQIDKELLQKAATESPYSFALDADTLHQITAYKLALVNGAIKPGTELLRLILKKMAMSDISSLTDLEFINLLLNLKVPKAFAEHILRNPTSSPYNTSELNILARIGTVIYTHVHNDGKQDGFTSYQEPVPCIMGFVSAPLFNRDGSAPANEALVDSSRGINQINSEKYIEEMEHRILPVLIKMNDEASIRKKRLSVTIPGLGCGRFAGRYGSDNGNNTVQEQLNLALIAMLEKHHARLKCIKDIHVDVFLYLGDEAITREQSIGHIKYNFVAGALEQNPRAPLALARVPSAVSTSDTDSGLAVDVSSSSDADNNVMLGTIVAGDLLSWMGNDMWNDDSNDTTRRPVNGRNTDEGCKTGSSLVLAQISQWIYRSYQINIIDNISYNVVSGKYLHSLYSWNAVANTRGLIHARQPYSSIKTPVFVLKDNAVLESIADVSRNEKSNGSKTVTLDETLDNIGTKLLSDSFPSNMNASKIVEKIQTYYKDKHDTTWLRKECKPYLKALLVELEAEPTNLYESLISALRYVFGKIDFFDITPKTFGLNRSHFFTPTYTQLGSEIDALNTELENALTNQ